RRLLDDADQRLVTARVEADHAELLLREVPALAAEADPCLHLADRVGEGQGFLVRHPQQMEREPLRRARADAGQARQLGDQVLDDGAEHGRSAAHCAYMPGRPRPLRPPVTPPSFDWASSCALRSASLTPARTRSSSVSGSSGSIASGEILT